ncbi:hypothetical protein [Halobaculum sp. EA56]|uniref:hypothetical protein n=1 Tax=Halobaculum sp. EA56 TaxID=3421648 RepID=UPI003EBF6AF1
MSGAIRAAANRAPTDEGTCPACGAGLVDARCPKGYSRLHCVRCATEIEARHTWHARRDSVRGGR